MPGQLSAFVIRDVLGFPQSRFAELVCGNVKFHKVRSWWEILVDFRTDFKVCGIWTVRKLFPQTKVCGIPKTWKYQVVWNFSGSAGKHDHFWEMKKSSTPTKKFLGEGVFLQQEFPEEKKKQPYNKGKKYFFWSIATTILLLKECLDKDISAVNL